MAKVIKFPSSPGFSNNAKYKEGGDIICLDKSSSGSDLDVNKKIVKRASGSTKSPPKAVSGGSFSLSGICKKAIYFLMLVVQILWPILRWVIAAYFAFSFFLFFVRWDDLGWVGVISPAVSFLILAFLSGKVATFRAN